MIEVKQGKVRVYKKQHNKSIHTKKNTQIQYTIGNYI